jgi:anti-sigma regulatory factor (Ser/Thr protein kinase)
MALVIYLDIFPIKLKSGDEYSAGTIGTLYLLYELGMGAVAIEIIISTLFSFSKRYGSIRNMNWIRYTTTISMYFLSAFFALTVIQITEGVNLFLSVLLTVITFELANTLLLAGIFKSFFGTPLFQGFYMKLRELIIPVLVCMVVLPRFLFIEDTKQFTIEIIYTAFFLAIIIFFSGHFMQQVNINQSANKKFIELLETRTATKLLGHGTRVGEICEVLSDLFDYPKKDRNNLIQVAVIHDIGKSLIPSHLLQKRGALTLSEEKVYQSHSEKGAEIVESIFVQSNIRDWILYHHERWDGKGFPLGLKKNKIPLEARIISLCNQLDYLMNRHPDDTTVYQLLQEMSGTLLDPTLVSKIDETLISEIRESLPTHLVTTSEEIDFKSEQEIDAKSYIGKSFFIRYEHDNLIGLEPDFPVKNSILELAKVAQKRNKPFHETITHQLETFEIHFYPISTNVLIFIHDVTPMLMYRHKLMKDTLESYQDVISTLSEEKIQLCLDEIELEQYKGEYVNSIDVRSSSDVPESRRFVSSYISDLSLQLQSKILLAVSEAATNMIKHSTGGKVIIYKKDQMIQVMVADQGSGIPIHEIPKTILISGYSSKHSLGKGFLLISRSADKIRLHTSSNGTSLLMEFTYPKEKEDPKST